MSLLSYLSNLFAPKGGIPRAPDIPMPPVAPPKDRTPQPSYLAKGIAKAWIDDRDKWTVVRERSDCTHSWIVQLDYPPLGIVIKLTEWDSAQLSGLRVSIGGEERICEYHYRMPQVHQDEQRRDINHLTNVICLNAYPELKERIDAAARETAARARNIKAIEALGVSQDPDRMG